MDHDPNFPVRFSPPCVFLLSTLLLCGQSGCISSRYKSAPSNTPPATLLTFPSATLPVPPVGSFAPEIALHSVINFRGPGSWKRDAYWDEYVFTVANHTPAVVHVDAATLTDFEGESLSPGTDPWEIEKESRSSIARFRAATGTTLKISGGAVASSVGGVLGGAGVASGGGYFVALSGAAVGAMVAVPLFVGFTIYGNLSDKHYIEDQFRYRRLALPFTLAPGQVVHGSLFFRISPQPQRLVVRSTAEGQAPTDRIFELNPLVVSSPPAQADPRKKF